MRACQAQTKLVTRWINRAVIAYWTAQSRLLHLPGGWGREWNCSTYTTEFPPNRKCVEVLPIHSRLPSCLHPLSRSEGIGLIWVLNDCYCFIHSRSAYIVACVVQRQPETDSPFSQKAKYLTPSAFVTLFLGAHSFGLNFYAIYAEQYLCFCHWGFRSTSCFGYNVSICWFNILSCYLFALSVLVENPHLSVLCEEKISLRENDTKKNDTSDFGNAKGSCRISLSDSWCYCIPFFVRQPWEYASLNKTHSC